MNLFQAIILGIIQGITEWLPVSSSGHLVLFQKLFGLEKVVSFDIALHLATMLVVVLVFWKDIINIKKKLILYLLIGTIPIGLIGFFFYEYIISLFESLFAVSLALIFTGIFLLLTKLSKEKMNLNLKNSFLIGLFQSIAILPGLSRSGMTVGSSLLFGLKREEAIRFSFLLYLPAAFGAFILESTKMDYNSIELAPILIGMLVAFVVGYFALKWLIKVIKKDKFWMFGIYCILLGLILLIL